MRNGLHPTATEILNVEQSALDVARGDMRDKDVLAHCLGTRPHIPSGLSHAKNGPLRDGVYKVLYARSSMQAS